MSLLYHKLLIPVATTFGAYVLIQFTIGDELHGIVGPLVIVAILAWFTANLFNEVSDHRASETQASSLFGSVNPLG